MPAPRSCGLRFSCAEDNEFTGEGGSAGIEVLANSSRETCPPKCCSHKRTIRLPGPDVNFNLAQDLQDIPYCLP